MELFRSKIKKTSSISSTTCSFYSDTTISEDLNCGTLYIGPSATVTVNAGVNVLCDCVISDGDLIVNGDLTTGQLVSADNFVVTSKGTDSFKVITSRNVLTTYPTDTKGTDSFETLVSRDSLTTYPTDTKGTDIFRDEQSQDSLNDYPEESFDI